MRMKLTAAVLGFWITAVWIGSAGAAVPASERNALIDLYNSTNGASWTDNTGWNGAAGTECSWYGVTCDAGETTVLTLKLQQDNLAGPIPASLENLTNLRTLWLWNNQLTGSLPSELGNLGSLEDLRLNGNQLAGSVPASFGSLAGLTHLDLASNLLDAIPPEIGNLSSLQYLLLSNNQLTGSIPPELGNITSLLSLSLAANPLSPGPIPSWLQSLVNLRFLDLGSTNRNGKIPAFLGNLNGLLFLSLYSNQLTGAIPPELGNLPALQTLYLYNNQLSGPIPPELGNLTSLQYLNLRSNQLSGEVPATLTNLTSLVDAGSDLRWNALHSIDANLVTFLNAKQQGGDWQSTQTVAPAEVTAGAVSDTTVALSWTPIAYQGGSGGYEVLFATTPGGPYLSAGSTADKTASGTTISGLDPATHYDFVVRTVTDPHLYNQSTVTSELSVEIAATTLSGSSPELTIGDCSVVEGDSGTVSANFTVSLYPAASATVTVDWATADATALAGEDYAAGSGTLSFAAGETTKVAAITVYGDTTPELDQQFRVNLSNPSGATVTDGSGTGTIISDDACSTLALDNLSIGYMQTFGSCGDVTMGPAFQVIAPGGDVTVKSAGRIVLKNGVTVESGASLKLVLDPGAQ